MSIETEGFATDTSPRTAGRLVGSYRVLWSVLLLGWLTQLVSRYVQRALSHFRVHFSFAAHRLCREAPVDVAPMLVNA